MCAALPCSAVHSLLVFSSVDVDHVGVAHHHGVTVAVAELSVSQRNVLVTGIAALAVGRHGGKGIMLGIDVEQSRSDLSAGWGGQGQKSKGRYKTVVATVRSRSLGK